jgi:hypothetical protein
MFKVNGQIYTHQEMEATNRDDVEFLEWLATAQPGSTWKDGETVECVADVPKLSEVERLRARNAGLVELLRQARTALGVACDSCTYDNLYRTRTISRIDTALKGD